jgi:hypothetical protein
VIDTLPTDDTPHIYAENLSNGGSQTKTREYTGKYSQDNPLLQSGAEPAFAESAPQKNRRFLQSALEDPTPELAEALERYRRGQLSLVALADHMRGAVYLRGCTAYDSLRPEQVGAALEELGVEQEE